MSVLKIQRNKVTGFREFPNSASRLSFPIFSDLWSESATMKAEIAGIIGIMSGGSGARIGARELALAASMAATAAGEGGVILHLSEQLLHVGKP
jgi:hypothetical protein